MGALSLNWATFRLRPALCVWCALWCLFALLPVRAQSPSAPSHEIYSLEDGLSQSTIHSIVRDHLGFLWFGTGDGLNRFDGVSFHAYRYGQSDAIGMADDQIWSLTQSSDGIIWFGTNNGLHAYDPAANIFTPPVRIRELPPFFHGRQITASRFDRLNTLWVRADTVFAAMTVSGTQITSCNTVGRYTVNERYLAADDRGSMRVGGAGMIRILHADGSRPDTILIPVRNRIQITAELTDRAGTTWIGTMGEGLYRRKAGEHHWTQHLPDPAFRHGPFANQISGIVEDNNGTLWVSTRGIGLTTFDRDRGLFNRFIPNSAGRSHLRFEAAATMLLDSTGILWVGYDGSGVVRIDTKPKKFRHILLGKQGEDGTGINFFKPMLFDRRGNLWLGTFDWGLIRLDPSFRLAAHYRHKPQDRSGLRSNSLLALLEDRAGMLWIGTVTGLDELEPATGTFRHHELPGIGEGSSNASITALCEDSAGVLWIGTMQGLFRFEKALRRPVAVPGFPDRIEALAASADGSLWIGLYYKGAIRYFPGRDSVVRYAAGESGERKLSHDFVKCILPGNTVTWLGTAGGLDRIDPGTGRIHRYTTRDGLSNDFVYGILADRSGRLWLSTNGGIICGGFEDPDHPVIRNYSLDDGLQSLEFNSKAYATNRSGWMVFGGLNGFNLFHPDSVRDNAYAPRPVVTGFKKFDQPAAEGFIPGPRAAVTLEYTESVFSFEFAGLEYTNPRRNRYQYRMDGFDRAWIDAGTRREARFTHLDPGSYTFRVRSANNDGVWGPGEAIVEVTIVPPFWRRSWFIILAVAGLAAVFGSTVRYYSTRTLRARLRELEYQQRLQEERERISRDLHDTVGAQLVSIISGLAMVERTSPAENGAVRRLFDSLRQDARESITQLRETIWALKVHAIDIRQFGEKVESSIRRRIEFLPELSLEVSLPAGVTAVISPEESLVGLRIIQEAVSNILKHARARQIAVSVGIPRKDQLEIIIADDGCGIPDDALEGSHGNGLDNMRSRAREIGGSVAISRRPEGGTIIAVLLPLRRAGIPPSRD